MAWCLEIHHIDVGQGDSTLIVAREEAPLIGKTPIVRSCLIDGGLYGQGATVDKYIASRLDKLNVMVATHYDKDHYGGLRMLLEKGLKRKPSGAANPYTEVRIYDQGWSSVRDGDYTRYIRAINTINATNTKRIRVTNQVAADVDKGYVFIEATENIGPPAVHMSLPKADGGNLILAELPHALLRKDPKTKTPAWTGREILWEGSSLPPGAPTIRCIAANGFVLRNGGGKPNQHSSGISIDPRNEKSLAFLVEFNNFRYYIGGDIESVQEDGEKKDGIMHYLNPADNVAGRVHAMKCSHHGSERSTSNKFMGRLRPIAAFISCGEGNSYGHPSHRVIQYMQNSDSAGIAEVENVYLSSYGAGLPGPHNDVATVSGINDSTGEHSRNEGHIVIKVSEDNSNMARTDVQMAVEYREKTASGWDVRIVEHPSALAP